MNSPERLLAKEHPVCTQFCVRYVYIFNEPETGELAHAYADCSDDDDDSSSSIDSNKQHQKQTLC